MIIQVIGAGGWGLALARVLALNGHETRLWCRSAEQAERLRESREDATLLPGVQLPASISISNSVQPSVEMAIFAVPSHAMRRVAEAYPLEPGVVRVSVSKGIENETLLRMSEVIAAVAPGGPVVSLSGPSHAEEVGRGLPASLVAAGQNQEAAQRVQEAFFAPAFRIYTSPDIIGVELGGALKNVIAIAAGACDGLGLGDNAKAALLTRGLAEITRFGVACGADPLTFAGLSGMGDLIVTCTSRHSRNRRVGEAISQGKTLDEVVAGSPMVAEGVRTTRSARALARQRGVEMPITEAVYRVLFEQQAPRDALESLLLREAKPELG